MSVKNQIAKLRELATHYIDANGEFVVTEVEKNSSRVLQWLPYLERFKTGTANDLLGGVASSLVEAAACAALGLIRPALFSMRTQIDVILTWLYFKDHKVEWENVNATGDGFKLKRELFDYFSKYYSGFADRIGTLNQIATRPEVDVYRFLSAHIHSQSSTTLPLAKELCDVVRDKKAGKELTIIAKCVDEYVSDLLLAIFLKDWVHIPSPIISELDGRFKSKVQKQNFYKLA